MARDHVEVILSQWRKERPDIDPSPMGIFGRMLRLNKYAQQKLEANFKRYGLLGGTFDLLATLRRNGEPFTLNPNQLQSEMMLSSGATTHRIDLLEKRGLIERLPDPEDRRGTLVRLTPEGKKLIDGAVRAHVELEDELLTGLTEKQRQELAELLSVYAEKLGL